MAGIRESFLWSRKVLELQAKNLYKFFYREVNSVMVASLMVCSALVDFTRGWEDRSVSELILHQQYERLHSLTYLLPNNWTW